MSVLVKRLTIVFGLPDSEDPQGYMAEISRLIRGYAEPEQQKAADYLIRDNKWWPKPSEIAVACADARETLNVNNRTEDKKKQHLDWAGPALKTADQMIQSEIGRRAADEGWVLSLWNFCRKHNRLPTGSEISGCKQEARGFDEAYAQCVRGGWGQAQKLRELGDMMLARRKQKAAWAYGEITDRKVDRKMAAAGDA